MQSIIVRVLIMLRRQAMAEHDGVVRAFAQVPYVSPYFGMTNILRSARNCMCASSCLESCPSACLWLWDIMNGVIHLVRGDINPASSQPRRSRQRLELELPR